MEFFLSHIPDFIQVIGLIVTAASIITAMTPSTSDDAIVNSIQKVLNFLSLNFGKNKNVDDK